MQSHIHIDTNQYVTYKHSMKTLWPILYKIYYDVVYIVPRGTMDEIQSNAYDLYSDRKPQRREVSRNWVNFQKTSHLRTDFEHLGGIS